MIRVILIDDEEVSLNMTEMLLDNISGVTVEGKFQNPIKGLDAIKKLRPNAVFLDIEMPEINGIDIAEQIIDSNLETDIVFITAYSEYAVKAFEINSLDYILKPLNPKRLNKTVERLIHKNKIYQSYQSNYSNNSKLLNVRCFNTFEAISLNSEKTIKWRTMKERELFAYLMDCAMFKKVAERDMIIEMLWPDADYKKAKIYLHTCISYIKSSLKKEGLHDAITFQNGKYNLSLEQINCDVIEFTKEINNINKISSDIEKLKEIEKAYIGDYLSNDAFIWSYNTREELRRKYIGCLRYMLDFYKTKKDFANAIVYLEKIIGIDLYSENYYKDLIDIHLMNGDNAKAIDLYHRLEELLEKDLAVKPSREIRNLLESIS